MATTKPAKKQAATTAKPSQPLNPKTTYFDFMGPTMSPVVMAVILAVPHVLYVVCNPTDGAVPTWLLTESPDAWAARFKRHFASLWSPTAFAVMLAWYAYIVALWYVLPARIVHGTLLRDGKTRLAYPLNGFGTLAVTLALLGVYVQLYGPGVLLWVASEFPQLCASAGAVALVLAIALYAGSFRSDNVLLAAGGNSGYWVYDLWIGRELNPRLLGIDLKYLCELRPGLIGWLVLNLASAARQTVPQGLGEAEVAALGWTWVARVSPAMALVVLFQAYYVFDALWNEDAILTTMDLTTDGFGFMLAVGDLYWVPFTYSTQARFLSFHPYSMPPAAGAAVVALNLAGNFIFRGANGQKNLFRTNPDSPACKNFKYMTTESGSKLLISGWWGLARHINYTGDWLMALSWCLPTGFTTPVTYFYAIYFAVLLWHREIRDEFKCKVKYGKDWEKYCRIVPFRFVPYLY
ncbi:erg24, C-14 sterol reductase [Cladochytrium tenue]|nr:erg24, C-14 sterol reductase [Cladochytrium tenue]